MDIRQGDNSCDRKQPYDNPRTMRHLDVHVVTFKACMDSYVNTDDVTISQNRQLCVGYPQGNCDSWHAYVCASIVACESAKFQQLTVFCLVLYVCRLGDDEN